MTQITNALIRTFNPCYDPSKYLKDTDSLSVVEFLKKEEIPVNDRLWVVTRTAVVEENILRLYAVKMARYALDRLNDRKLAKELAEHVDVAEKYALGLTDAVALSAANSAAISAALSAAISAAISAANSAANSAAISAAYSAANSAANSAAYSAANSAANSAAYSAAYSAANSAAIAALIKLLDQPAIMQQQTGVKHDGEKPDMSLLSTIGVTKIAEVMTFGKKKYAAHNWRGGISYSRLLAAALRHLFAYLGGETNDPESGLSHLAHCGCCVLMLLEFETTRPDLDDRYKEVTNAGDTK